MGRWTNIEKKRKKSLTDQWEGKLMSNKDNMKRIENRRMWIVGYMQKARR